MNIFFLFILAIFSHQPIKQDLKNKINQPGFTVMLKKSLNDYIINERKNASFLNLSNLKEIIIKRSHSELVVYYEIPSNLTDSTFNQKYLEYCGKQSCLIVHKDSAHIENFIYGKFVYLKKPCTECSELFDKECYRFKNKFMKFLAEKNIRLYQP